MEKKEFLEFKEWLLNEAIYAVADLKHKSLINNKK